MSKEVELKNIEKNYGDFKASDNVNLAVEKGRLIGLLGPSGSGKTTILRMIAGLEQPDKGDIFIAGQRVNDLPAGKRGIGFVFQNYALFNHMTVAENIAFGLQVQKADKKKIQQRTEMLAELGFPNKLCHKWGSRMLINFCRRPYLLHMTFIGNDNIICHLYCLILIVGNKNTGNTQLMNHTAKPLPQILSHLGINGGKRLIQQQKLRLCPE